MKKILEDDFFESLSEDTIKASRAIIQRYEEWQEKYSDYYDLDEESYKDMLDFYGFIKSFIEIHQLQIEVAIKPDLDRKLDYDSVKNVVNNLLSIITNRDRQNVFSKAYKYYSSLIPGYTYEFLDSDFNRLQELINEIRTLTKESDKLDEGYRRRLERRIKKVQAEFNKKMASLDVFWGMLGESGVALGKFDENIKPLTIRIAEILRIVFRTEGRAGGLSPGKEKSLLSAVQGIVEQSEPGR
jgi:hypothetical protein